MKISEIFLDIENQIGIIITMAKVNNIIKPVKFGIEAGALLRGGLRRFLHAVKFKIDSVNINWTESKGWLSSDFFITIEAKDSDEVTFRLIAEKIKTTFREFVEENQNL